MIRSDDRARLLAATLRLEPHPEGGRYRQLHRSTSVVEDPNRAVRRSALTAILFLLARGEVSRWHRVTSDEAWTFHEGDGLELLVVDAGLTRVDRHLLGPASEGLEPLAVVPAGSWQAAKPVGHFALVSCAVGPGFEFEDFALLADFAAEAERLSALAPDLAAFV